jgi:hypothetical protein
MTRRRRIVQVTAHNSRLIALADDGTLWVSTESEAQPWIELKGIPDGDGEQVRCAACDHHRYTHSEQFGCELRACECGGFAQP